MKILCLVAILLTATACSLPIRPSAEHLDELAVIPLGADVPAGQDYVLYFPAGVKIPTEVWIGGTLFASDTQQHLSVALKRDIYVYKQWVSYDRQTWLSARDVIDSDIDIKIPGYDYPRLGHIRIRMDER